MSRDQRPGRVQMVDSAPEDLGAGRRETDIAASEAAAKAAAPAKGPPMLLLSAVFLVACAASAAAFSYAMASGLLG